MTTERSYYRDCYTSSFEAKVVAKSSDERRIYLNRTFFYPTSGGQPNDTGVVNGIPVTDVVDEGDQIAHVLAEPLTADFAQAKLNWERRFDHMQQHSGQHLLSAVFLGSLGIETLSFHMGSELSTIELGTKGLSAAQISSVEENANELVRAAVPLTISFQDAEAAEQLRKQSSRSGTLRIIEISGIDRSACGGTHVRNTAEIGAIQIRGSEKIRGNIRVEFVCGIRALRRARKDFEILADLARQSAVSIEKLSEHSGSVRQRLVDAERDREKLKEQISREQANSRYAQTPASPDGVRRLLLRVPSLDESSRTFASAFTAHGQAICLIVGDEPPAVLIGSSSDSGVDVGALVKKILAERGGRGGGSATLAQAKLQDKDSVETFVHALGFEFISRTT